MFGLWIIVLIRKPLHRNRVILYSAGVTFAAIAVNYFVKLWA